MGILAEDLASGDKGGDETLAILKEYIQRISDEMSLLDTKMSAEDKE